MRILFVCLGNICRSPMAEGIMRKKAIERDLELFIDSCGTGDYHEGENPDPRAQEEMLSRGMDISHLVARAFEEEDFGAEENFKTVYELLDRASDRILKEIEDEQLQR